MKYRTFYGPMPSFWEGVARAFDLGGVLEYYPHRQFQDRLTADADAIRRAWETVGESLYDAMGRFEVEELADRG